MNQNEISPKEKTFLKIVQYQTDIEANTILKKIYIFFSVRAKNTRLI